MNLRKRGVQVDEICRLYREDAETIEQLFFHCGRSQLIRKLSPVSWEELQNNTNSFREWWKEQSRVKNSWDLQDRQEFTTYLMWHIWKARNAWIFNGEKRSEIEVVQHAWEEWLEFKEKQKKDKREVERKIRVEERIAWTTPNPGSIKINAS